MMKKFMKKLWEKKDSKKGFTLVELIVVLVILAILAAIMVPSLLGWINKAREKEGVLEARNAYLALQTVIFEKHVKTPIEGDVEKGELSEEEQKEFEELSKLEASYVKSFSYNEKGEITKLVYDNGKFKATFDGEDWKTGEADAE